MFLFLNAAPPATPLSKERWKLSQATKFVPTELLSIVAEAPANNSDGSGINTVFESEPQFTSAPLLEDPIPISRDKVVPLAV